MCNIDDDAQSKSPHQEPTAPSGLRPQALFRSQSTESVAEAPTPGAKRGRSTGEFSSQDSSHSDRKRVKDNEEDGPEATSTPLSQKNIQNTSDPYEDIAEFFSSDPESGISKVISFLTPSAKKKNETPRKVSEDNLDSGADASLAWQNESLRIVAANDPDPVLVSAIQSGISLKKPEPVVPESPGSQSVNTTQTQQQPTEDEQRPSAASSQ